MVYQSDVAKYSVSFKKLISEKAELVTLSFDTFAAAAGCASALDGVRLLNVQFSNAAGDSSISGSLYIYQADGTRRACNNYLISQVTKRNGL
jgi:hypothetical protein